MQSNFLIRLPLALCLSLLCACTSRAPQVPRPLPTQLSGAAATAALERLTSCNAAVHSFRGLARAALQQEEERNAFRYVVVFEKPERFRLEALPTNAVYTLSLLVSDQQEMLYLDPAAKMAQRGPLSAATVKKYLGIPVLPSSLMALLTGCAPFDESGAESTQVSEDSARQLVQVRSSKFLYEMGGPELEPRRVFLINQFDDHVALLVEWSEFQDVRGVKLPSTIVLTMPEHAVTLTLHFTSVDINGEYPERLFQAQIPSDFEVQ
ncbi:MAG: DUF4292 domain-containing protein [Deltaproteobacteria bacterium]|nr:DUF4292 domain-containing protein [Deltaproteobacteria bacterium]